MLQGSLAWGSIPPVVSAVVHAAAAPFVAVPSAVARAFAARVVAARAAVAVVASATVAASVLHAAAAALLPARMLCTVDLVQLQVPFTFIDHACKNQRM